MQKPLLYLVILLLFSFGPANQVLAGHKPHPRYKIVKVKPAHHYRAHRPAHIRPGYVWIEGHWVWHKRQHNYVWVKGRVVKKRQHKTWVNGHWQRVRGGWVYVPGFWA